MCPVNGNIVYRGTTRPACTLFDGRLLRPESDCTLTNRSVLYYYILVTGRPKVGTTSAPQRLDFPRAVL